VVLDVVYLLALASAALYGAADFMGGLASRRASTVAIVVLSQFAGMVTLAVLLPLLPSADPGRADVLWGVAAGLSGSAGVALLYRALAIGTMAIVAPTTAVCAVVIPVAAGLALGERPPVMTIAGIVLAIVAIVLVSRQSVSSDAPRGSRASGSLPPGIALALASGVTIGLFFLSLARTSPAAGLWPLLVARVVSVGLFGLIAAGRRIPLRTARSVLTVAVVGGILDMLANALYVVAARQGPLSVVVTLSSLYPASTVLLARVVLGERLSTTQTIGIGCALLAVIVIVS
jgi:drug/metabolite transporter (DMT)-like permease